MSQSFNMVICSQVLGNPTIFIIIWCIFSFLFIGWEPTTWPANNCQQIRVLLQIIMFCSCVIETVLLCENGRLVPKTVREWFDVFCWSKEQWWNDKTIIELGYCKILWFVSVLQINNIICLSWSACHWQVMIFCSTLLNNYCQVLVKLHLNMHEDNFNFVLTEMHVTNRAIFKPVKDTDIIKQLLLHLVIVWKIVDQCFKQWEAKHQNHNFPGGLSKLQVIARNSDWFIVLFAPVVISHSNYFWYWFSTVIWKPTSFTKIVFFILDKGCHWSVELFLFSYQVSTV